MAPHFRNRLAGQRGPELYEGPGTPPRGLIQTPDIQRRLVKALGLRERVPAPTLAPEILAVVIAEDLREPDEFSGPNIRSCVGAVDVVGIAGQFPAAAVFNPIGSNVVLHIDAVTLTLISSAPNTSWGFVTSGIGGTAVGEAFLNRTLDGNPAGQMTANTVAVGPSVIARWHLGAELPFRWEPDGLFLPEGQGIEFIGEPAGTTTSLFIQFEWHESAKVR